MATCFWKGNLVFLSLSINFCLCPGSSARKVNECMELAALFFWWGYISDGLTFPDHILRLDGCQHWCTESGGSWQPGGGRGVGGTTCVRDSWLLDELWFVRCWQDTWAASAAGSGEQFPSISDNFIDLYWVIDFFLAVLHFGCTTLCTYFFKLLECACILQLLLRSSEIYQLQFQPSVIRYFIFFPFGSVGAFCFGLFSILFLKMFSLSPFIYRNSWFHVSDHMDSFQNSSELRWTNCTDNWTENKIEVSVTC